ncbi:sensor histidine kinase [Sphingobacterium sp. Mn56C]|uniref:sensor histidine kinase n=1 Tax=Sphingobacterium sp. Mn56C TaxID=3395261 RepID=UPI003BC3FA73
MEYSIENQNIGLTKFIKRLFLIALSFIGAYVIPLVFLPYSGYWQRYERMSTQELLLDVGYNLLIAVAQVEISIAIDNFLNKKMPWTAKPITRLVVQTLMQVFAMLLMLIIVAVAVLAFRGDSFVSTGTEVVDIRQSLYLLLAFVGVALMISALNTGSYLLDSWKAETIRAAVYKVKDAENKQLLVEAELEALKLQLDPHFVFNNLSVLSELILKDQQMGYRYTENFAKVYRYLLTNAKKPLITLREELQFMEAYIYLVQHRMGAGVAFTLAIDEAQRNLLIPPVTLQLFIENAVKYNRTDEEEPLQVVIRSAGPDSVEVSNNRLPLVYPPRSTGLGLRNIMGRYALLTERKVEIVERNDFFAVTIPLL